MATSTSLSNCYIYNNHCTPNFDGLPLHLAAYNGRTAKFRQLVDSHNVYERNSDRHNASPLTVAISRAHPDIAAICLRFVQLDLAILDQHFARIGGSVYESHFWLRQRVLIISKPEDVQFAREEGAFLLADPAEMRPAQGPARSGLLVILKASNSDDKDVLWLTARNAGDDRRLARLVARCSQRDGFLDVLQRDLWDRTDFHIAARRNLPDIWHQMHTMYGKYVLTRREYAVCFRLLAEHQPVAERVAHFEELCRTTGGFEAADLFDSGDGDEQALLTFQVLEDALKQFNGDLQLLDHLVELAAKVVQTRKSCSLQQAISEVIVQRNPDEKYLSTVMDWTFHSMDDTLIWKCLRYQPDLMCMFSDGRRELIWTLLEHPKPEFDADLSDLISKQLIDEHQILVDLFKELCRKNFSISANAVWTITPSKMLLKPDKCEELLQEAMVAGHFGTVLLLLQLLAPKARLAISAQALRSESYTKKVIPDAVWGQLLIGDPAEWDRKQVGHLLCAALKAGQIDAYQRVLGLVEGSVQLSELCDHEKVPILFHAIYNAAAIEPAHYAIQPYAESAEIIDSDDDADSSCQKSAINANRRAGENPYHEAVLRVDDRLEATYWQVFADLLADGCDFNTIHPVSGQSLLHVAVERNNLPVARHLLELGIPSSTEDFSFNVPITFVRSAEMMVLLPAADVRHVNRKTKRTPLAEYLLANDRIGHDVRLVGALLAAGADCNRPDEADGCTPLMMEPSAEVATLLLRAGADVNAVDERGQTALYRYRYCRDVQLVWTLLRWPGVNLWPVAVEGDTVLQSLSKFIPLQELREVFPEIGEDQRRLQQLFVEKGIGLGALSLMQRDECEDDLRCLQLLLEQEDLDLDDDQMVWTYDHARLYLERGAHISQRSDKRPLDWTKCEQPLNIFNEIEFFAKSGVNFDYSNGGPYGETALQAYCDNIRDIWLEERIVASLIAVGANYRLRTYDQNPALKGMVLECLYEWDEMRGLRLPDVRE